MYESEFAYTSAYYVFVLVIHILLNEDLPLLIKVIHSGFKSSTRCICMPFTFHNKFSSHFHYSQVNKLTLGSNMFWDLIVLLETEQFIKCLWHIWLERDIKYNSLHSTMFGNFGLIYDLFYSTNVALKNKTSTWWKFTDKTIAIHTQTYRGKLNKQEKLENWTSMLIHLKLPGSWNKCFNFFFSSVQEQTFWQATIQLQQLELCAWKGYTGGGGVK